MWKMENERRKKKGSSHKSLYHSWAIFIYCFGLLFERRKKKTQQRISLVHLHELFLYLERVSDTRKIKWKVDLQWDQNKWKFKCEVEFFKRRWELKEKFVFKWQKRHERHVIRKPFFSDRNEQFRDNDLLNFDEHLQLVDWIDERIFNNLVLRIENRKLDDFVKNRDSSRWLFEHLKTGWLAASKAQQKLWITAWTMNLLEPWHVLLKLNRFWISPPWTVA